MQSTSLETVWITSDMLEISLKPIYEALEDSQSCEDALFSHFRELLAWKDTVDQTWDLDAFRQQISALTLDVVKQFTDRATQQQDEWKQKFSLEVLSLLSQGNLGAQSMSKDLQEVWSNLSTRVESLRVAWQAQEG